MGRPNGILPFLRRNKHLRFEFTASWMGVFENQVESGDAFVYYSMRFVVFARKSVNNHKDVTLALIPIQPII
jgi:hypothetical protein